MGKWIVNGTYKNFKLPLGIMFRCILCILRTVFIGVMHSSRKVLNHTLNVCGSVNWNVVEVNTPPLEMYNSRKMRGPRKLRNTVRTNNKIESHRNITELVEISYCFHESNKSCSKLIWCKLWQTPFCIRHAIYSAYNSS